VCLPLNSGWVLALHEHVRGNSFPLFFELVPHSKNSILGPREIAFTPTLLLLVHKSNRSLFRCTHYLSMAQAYDQRVFLLASGEARPRPNRRWSAGLERVHQGVCSSEFFVFPCGGTWRPYISLRFGNTTRSSLRLSIVRVGGCG